MTLDGSRIQHDYVNVRVTMNASKSEASADAHFAKYMSMGCGNACFNPVITEKDLLVGRVCMEVRKIQHPTTTVLGTTKTLKLRPGEDNAADRRR